jgi:8-oxo-dGTP diphosphatase
MKQVEVVAAIIYDIDKILCVQRAENKLAYISKKYEFPGGKIEQGESKEQTIKREIFEELNIDLIVGEQFITVMHTYPDFELTMHTFKCTGDVKNLKLNEHIDYKWLSLSELESLDWAAADVPIVNELLKING